jgi:hypothetical protein
MIAINTGCFNRHWLSGLSVLIMLTLCSTVAAQDGVFSGYAGLETRLFTNDPAYPDQAHHDLSASLNLEYYQDLAGGNQRIIFQGFGRQGHGDSGRNHVDLRELYWWGRFEQVEATAGVRKVFWGVTETVHLVDVVNQDDRLENFDREDKLGQPMISLMFERDWGTLETFALLGFREAEFLNVRDRLRSPILVDDDAQYQSSAEDKRLDGALRYSHVLGDLDLGLYYFHGTDRDPQFTPFTNKDGELRLRPYYQLIDQVGLDMQATKEDWLLKLEAIGGEVVDGHSYSALVGGFEYTLYGLLDSATDLGLLLEYQFDDRTGALSDNDIALGARLVLNDEQSTEVLAALSVDLDNHSQFISVEASRRLTDIWHLEAEIRCFANTDKEDPLFLLRQDDYLQLELKRYF